MSLRIDEREWDDLAGRDALWAIASSREPGTWSDDEFLASGQAEVEGILAGLAGQDLLPPAMGSALDFGCGVGRLTRALGSRFEQAVGVDISAAMIDRARRLNADRPSCRFVHNTAPDLAVFEDGQFDFVLSLIALQHISSRDAIRSYVAEFARVTRPGGMIVFQLPSDVGRGIRHHPLRLLNRAVRRLPWSPDGVRARLMPFSMSLVGMPEAEVRELLRDSGARVVTAFADGRSGSDALPSVCYVALAER